MKNIFSGRILFSLVLAVLTSMLLFYTSCKKEDKKCEAVITAKFLSDTNIIVPFASIIVGENIYHPDLVVYGVTNAKGEYRHEFDLEAILDVDAFVDTSSFDSLVYEFTGSTMIRLKPGETVYRSVFLSAP